MLTKIGVAVVALVMFHSPATKVRLPRDYKAWSRVARCESGGWRVLGYAYPDSLGITRSNYIRFGGGPLAPGRVTLAGRLAQIRAADRMLAAYGIPFPDQGGCSAW